MIFERKSTVYRLSGPPSGPGPGSSDSIPPPAPGGYGPSFYPPAYYPPPPPNGSVVLIAGGRTLRVFWLDADSDQVFGTGDAFRVTGDSAPLPYSTLFRFDLMTSSGAIISGMTWTTGPRVMGVNITISGDGTNWTLLITSTPTGLTTSAVKLTIITSANLTALGPTAFSALTSGSWSTNHAHFVGTGGPTIVVGDRLLISTTAYPSGYSVQIADSQGVLYAHALG